MNVKLPVEPEQWLEAGQDVVVSRRPKSFASPWIKLLHLLNHVAVHTVGCVLLLVIVGGAGWLLSHVAFTKDATWFRGTRYELPAETVMQIADSAIFVIYVTSGALTTMVTLLVEWKEW